MLAVDFSEYNKAIDILEAQSMLVAFTIADYPNMKKEDKKRLHSRVYKTAYPHSVDAKGVTAQELARMLGGLNG